MPAHLLFFFVVFLEVRRENPFAERERAVAICTRRAPGRRQFFPGIWQRGPRRFQAP